MLGTVGYFEAQITSGARIFKYPAKSSTQLERVSNDEEDLQRTLFSAIRLMVCSGL